VRDNNSLLNRRGRNGRRTNRDPGGEITIKIKYEYPLFLALRTYENNYVRTIPTGVLSESVIHIYIYIYTRTRASVSRLKNTYLVYARMYINVRILRRRGLN